MTRSERQVTPFAARRMGRELTRWTSLVRPAPILTYLLAYLLGRLLTHESPQAELEQLQAGLGPGQLPKELEMQLAAAASGSDGRWCQFVLMLTPREQTWE